MELLGKLLAGHLVPLAKPHGLLVTCLERWWVVHGGMTPTKRFGFEFEGWLCFWVGWKILITSISDV